MTSRRPAWWLGGALAVASSRMLVGCADGGCPTEVRVGHIAVCADLAVTAEERLAGLRGRPSLSDTDGLLIRFPVEGEVCLVNDGVDFAIDAVLFDAAHRVTHVLSLAANDPTPRCAAPAKDVLEVASGLATNLSINTLGALP